MKILFSYLLWGPHNGLTLSLQVVEKTYQSSRPKTKPVLVSFKEVQITIEEDGKFKESLTIAKPIKVFSVWTVGCFLKNIPKINKEIIEEKYCEVIQNPDLNKDYPELSWLLPLLSKLDHLDISIDAGELLDALRSDDNVPNILIEVLEKLLRGESLPEYTPEMSGPPKSNWIKRGFVALKQKATSAIKTANKNILPQKSRSP